MLRVAEGVVGPGTLQLGEHPMFVPRHLDGDIRVVLPSDMMSFVGPFPFTEQIVLVAGNVRVSAIQRERIGFAASRAGTDRVASAEHSVSSFETLDFLDIVAGIRRPWSKWCHET